MLGAHPKVWKLENTEMNHANLASDYSSSRGTYVAIFEGGMSPKALLSLITHQNDVTGLST